MARPLLRPEHGSKKTDESDRERLQRETQEALDELFTEGRDNMITVSIPEDLLPGLHKVAKQMTKAKSN